MPDKHVHIDKVERCIFEIIELANRIFDACLDGTRYSMDEYSLIFFDTARDYAFRIKKLADEVLKKRHE